MGLLVSVLSVIIERGKGMGRRRRRGIGRWGWGSEGWGHDIVIWLSEIIFYCNSIGE